MHIHGQLYAPAREQALPQFELQVKQAARQRASERATPFSPSHLICRLSFECLVTSHLLYGEFVRRVCVHLLPATKVALPLSYYFKPQKHELRKYFFFRSRGKKRQVKHWHSRI